MWRMRDINVTPTLKPKVKFKLCSKASGHKFRHQSIKIPTSIDGKPKGGGKPWRAVGVASSYLRAIFAPVEFGA